MQLKKIAQFNCLGILPFPSYLIFNREHIRGSTGMIKGRLHTKSFYSHMGC